MPFVPACTPLRRSFSSLLGIAILAGPGCSKEPTPPIDLNDKPIVELPGSKPTPPATDQVEITKPKR